MTFEEKLKQYRDSYSFERKAVRSEATNEPVKIKSFDDDMEIPPIKQLAPTWEELDLPVEPMKHYDERFTGDKEVDSQNYLAYLESDPLMQQVGPQMESMLMEIDKQMLDPENPMTPEEAMETFSMMMEENFGGYFRQGE